MLATGRKEKRLPPDVDALSDCRAARSAAARRGAERSTDACQVAGVFLLVTATAGVALAEVLLRTDVEPRTPFMHDA
jgi:hypothetical protein